MGYIGEVPMLIARIIPKCFMYGISTYMYHGFKPNVGKYTVNGAYGIDTLPETNSSHLKMNGWKICFLLGRSLARCYGSFRGSERMGPL